MDTFTFTYAGAKIELKAETVIKNFLASVENKPNTQPLGIPKIGQPWPEQGGIYVGVIRGEDGQPDRHLILPTDPRAIFKDVKWGKEGKEVFACENNFYGMPNTVGMSKNGSQLAKDILSLEIDGHNDFYLMSRFEASLCYANARDFLDTDYWHWTSTQYSAHGAFVQRFDGGDQDILSKGRQCRARAVRSFVINSVI